MNSKALEVEFAVLHNFYFFQKHNDKFPFEDLNRGFAFLKGFFLSMDKGLQNHLDKRLFRNVKDMLLYLLRIDFDDSKKREGG